MSHSDSVPAEGDGVAQGLSRARHTMIGAFAFLAGCDRADGARALGARQAGTAVEHAIREIGRLGIEIGVASAGMCRSPDRSAAVGQQFDEVEPIAVEPHAEAAGARFELASDPADQCFVVNADDVIALRRIEERRLPD